jgi:hypothetical protein
VRVFVRRPEKDEGGSSVFRLSCDLVRLSPCDFSLCVCRESGGDSAVSFTRTDVSPRKSKRKEFSLSLSLSLPHSFTPSCAPFFLSSFPPFLLSSFPPFLLSAFPPFLLSTFPATIRPSSRLFDRSHSLFLPVVGKLDKQKFACPSESLDCRVYLLAYYLWL